MRITDFRLRRLARLRLQRPVPDNFHGPLEGPELAHCGSFRISSAWPLNSNDRSPAGGLAKTLAALDPNRAHGGNDRQPGSGRPGLQLLLRDQRSLALHQRLRRRQDVGVVVAPGRLQRQNGAIARSLNCAGMRSITDDSGMEATMLTSKLQFAQSPNTGPATRNLPLTNMDSLPEAARPDRQVKA